MKLRLCKIANVVTALIGVCYSTNQCSSFEAEQIQLPTLPHYSDNYSRINTTVTGIQRNSGEKIVTIQITLPEEEDFMDSTDSSSEDRFLTEITTGVQHLIEESIEAKKMEQLQNRMMEIIAGNTGISALFPQREEDLCKIDDVKRSQFIPLVRWILTVVKPEVAAYLKNKILKLDNNFITLINEKWGEGVYSSCSEILSTRLENYEIPCDVFGGINVDSIFSINPDLISDSRYNEFKKLILIINTVTQYISPEVTPWLSQLKTQIRKIVNTKFTREAIQTYLADHSQTEIEKSIAHYSLWIQLARTLS